MRGWFNQGYRHSLARRGMKLLRIAEFKLSVYPAHKSCFGKKDKVYLRMHKISGIKRFFELVGSNIRRKVPSYC